MEIRGIIASNIAIQIAVNLAVRKVKRDMGLLRILTVVFSSTSRATISTANRTPRVNATTRIVESPISITITEEVRKVNIVKAGLARIKNAPPKRVMVKKGCLISSLKETRVTAQYDLT